MASSNNFFSKLFRREHTLESTNFFDGYVDFHSHLLPSVDDGVEKIADTLKILEKYEHLGVKRVHFTPHIMEDLAQNNSGFLRSEFKEFQDKYSGKIELTLAAEYMLDSRFKDHLSHGDMLTFFDNHLLLETSYMSAPLYFYDTIRDVMSRGYNIVLAHPERYLYMSRDDYSSLKRMGVKFQLNLLSLTHYYGKRVKSNAEYLLDLGLYNFLGSDLHHLNMFRDRLLKIKLNNKLIDRLEIIKSQY